MTRRIIGSLGVLGICGSAALAGPPFREVYISGDTRVISSSGCVEQIDEGIRTSPIRSSGFQLHRLTHLIDGQIQDERGQQIGHVRELAVDPERGLVTFAIVETADREIVVPFTALDVEGGMHTDHPTLVLDIDRDRLRNAPAFRDWQRLADREFTRDLYSFYDERPYWEAGTDRPMLQGEPVGRERTDRGDRRMQFLRADSGLVSKVISDRDNRNIGRVEDLLVDQDSGRIAFVVARLDRNADIGDRGEFAAIPWGTFDVRGEGNRQDIVLNAPVSDIRGHTFSRSDWPQLTDARWAEETYRHYGQQPFWTEGGREGAMRRDLDRRDRDEMDRDRGRMDRERSDLDRNRNMNERDRDLQNRNRDVRDRDRAMQDRDRDLQNRNRDLQDRDRATQDRDRARSDRLDDTADPAERDRADESRDRADTRDQPEDELNQQDRATPRNEGGPTTQPTDAAPRQ